MKEKLYRCKVNHPCWACCLAQQGYLKINLYTGYTMDHNLSNHLAFLNKRMMIKTYNIYS